MFTVLITSMLANNSDKIIHEMVRRGFTVSPLSFEGKAKICTSDEESFSSLIYFQVNDFKNQNSPSKERMTSEKVFDEVVIALDNQQVKYYSLVVFVHTDTMWALGNIKREIEKPLDMGPYRTSQK